MAVVGGLRIRLVSAKLAYCPAFGLLCHSGVSHGKQIGVDPDLRRSVRFEMKFAGLSETRPGLLDMEFEHLYKPELKLWRGSDPHLDGAGS